MSNFSQSPLAQADIRMLHDRVTSYRTKPLSLRNNFIWMFSGNAIYASCQWAILVVLAKIGNPRLLGTYALAVAICTPIYMLSNLKLNAVQVTDFRNNYTFGQYISLRLVCTILAESIVILLVCFKRFDLQTATAVILIGLGQAILANRQIYLSFMQKKERMDYIAFSNALLGTITLMTFTITLWLTGNLLMGICCILCSRIAVFLLLDRRLVSILAKPSSEAFNYCWQIGILARLAQLAFPLGIVTVFLSLNNNIPNYLIENFQGREMLGYFSGIASVPAIGTVIIGALGQSASPRLARYYIESRQAYIRLVIKLIFFAFLLGSFIIISAYFVGEAFLTFIFDAEYAQFQKAFLVLIFAASIMYLWSFMEVSLTAARFFRMQMPIYIAVTVVCLFAGYLLIGMYSLLGASLTLLISNTVGFIATSCAVVHVAKFTGVN